LQPGIERVKACTSWHFAFDAFACSAMLSQQWNPCTNCKSANNAQIGGTTSILPDYIWVRAVHVVWA